MRRIPTYVHRLIKRAPHSVKEPSNIYVGIYNFFLLGKTTKQLKYRHSSLNDFLVNNRLDLGPTLPIQMTGFAARLSIATKHFGNCCLGVQLPPANQCSSPLIGCRQHTILALFAAETWPIVCGVCWWQHILSQKCSEFLNYKLQD